MQLFGFGGVVYQGVDAPHWYWRRDQDVWSLEFRWRVGKPFEALPDRSLMARRRVLGIIVFWNTPKRRRWLSLTEVRVKVDLDAQRAYADAFAEAAQEWPHPDGFAGGLTESRREDAK